MLTLSLFSFMQHFVSDFSCPLENPHLIRVSFCFDHTRLHWPMQTGSWIATCAHLLSHLSVFITPALSERGKRHVSNPIASWTQVERGESQPNCQEVALQVLFFLPYSVCLFPHPPWSLFDGICPFSRTTLALAETHPCLVPGKTWAKRAQKHVVARPVWYKLRNLE